MASVRFVVSFWRSKSDAMTEPTAYGPRGGVVPVALSKLAWVFGRLVRTAPLASRGALLIESIVAITLFTMIGTSALVGASALRNAQAGLQRQADAEYIVRNMMACTFDQAYQTSTLNYATSTCSSLPANFSSAVEQTLVSGDVDLQMVSVTVELGGKSILVVETLRGNH